MAPPTTTPLPYTPPTPHIDPSDGTRYYDMDQAMQLEPAHYLHWVYSPDTEKVDEVRAYTPRWKNTLLTKSPPWLPLFFWPPIIYALNAPLSLGDDLPLICVGLLLWFPLEYLFHRHFFHFDCTTKRGQKFHYLLHGIHHVAPKDLWHVFAPPHELGAQAVGVFFVLWALLGVRPARLIVAGLLLNYLRYDSVHYMVHSCRVEQLRRVPLIGRVLAHCKMQHMKHHFVNPRKDFAISFPLPLE